MSTRIPLAQVIENSTGQVRSVCRISVYSTIVQISTGFGLSCVDERSQASLLIVSPCLCCLFRHTAVIHQLAYALTLEFPLLAK